MLFVFGYRANKIRSKKISILIHNSDQHPNVTSCTVTVHFQKIVDKVQVTLYTKKADVDKITKTARAEYKPGGPDRGRARWREMAHEKGNKVPARYDD